jgi:Tol biopolymer transport system component
MVRRAVLLAVVSASLGAQAPPPQAPPQTRLTDALPGEVRVTQIAITSNARRVYYGDSSRAIWMYDRDDKRNVRLADGEAWDLAVSPAGNALAFKRTSKGSAEQHVWLLPLDARTGLAAGVERRASALQGDTPAFSADGKWLAFAADDSVGVGQGVVLVPVAGGRERTVVPFMRASVSSIRWSPDGRSLYYGVNPPVACDPEWSCLPLHEEFKQTTGSIHRVAVDGRDQATIATKVGGGWPGLAADGSVLAYTDTGFPVRLVVADTSGKRLASFPLVPRQTAEGWVNGSTLLFSDRGDARRLRSYSIADGSRQLLDDAADPIVEPSWSPDGKTIASIRFSPSTSQLRLSHADGSLIKAIDLPDRYGGGNLWSSDQRWIAYIGGPLNGERHLNVVDVSAGRVQQLAPIRSNLATVLWLPDSQGLIVSTTIGAGATRHATFQRVDLSGVSRALRELVIGAPPSAGIPIDATTAVLYASNEVKRVVIDGDSAETSLLPKSTGRVAGYVAVSTGDKRLAFRRGRTADGDLDVIEVVNPDGSNRTTIELPFQMLNGPNGLRILPGGSQVLVMGLPWQEERDIGIYLVTVDTKAVKKLFTIPISSFTGEFSLSPDGRTVLYVTNDLTTPRIFTMDLSSIRANNRQ